MRFFNTLLGNAPSLNQRVFHQQELELAGFTADKVETVSEGTFLNYKKYRVFYKNCFNSVWLQYNFPIGMVMIYFAK